MGNFSKYKDTDSDTFYLWSKINKWNTLSVSHPNFQRIAHQGIPQY
jgi:hypothetical protein